MPQRGYHKEIHTLQKLSIEQIKKHYRFTPHDESMLSALRPYVEGLMEDFLDQFYRYIFHFEYATIFLNNDLILTMHREQIGKWLLEIFDGTYDQHYFNRLQQISETHVRIGLPTHYVNAAFSFVREFLEKHLIHDHQKELCAVHKILDINLDILSLTYIEEEQQSFIRQVSILKYAVNNQKVIPYVQPIVHVPDGKLHKYETLMRLEDQEGNITQDIFTLLQVSKQIKLYEPLMWLMVESVFNLFRNTEYPFTINIGYEDITNRTFINFLIRQIKSYPDSSRITFEILESDFIEDFSIVYDFIMLLRELGCNIAIDDFGSGYSNMENILKLRPEYVKIDGSLIQNIDRSKHSLDIVKNIINMTKDLGILSVAEYVHSKEVWEVIKKLDVDFAQGYFLGVPLPAVEVIHG